MGYMMRLPFQNNVSTVATPEELHGTNSYICKTQKSEETEKIKLGNLSPLNANTTLLIQRVHKRANYPLIIENQQICLYKSSDSDPAWVVLNSKEGTSNIKLQKVWVLIDLPKCHKLLVPKNWVYRKQEREQRERHQNKATLVASRNYTTQEEDMTRMKYLCAPDG
ncbi:hypothetical protein Tco_0746513 [Tanacetum coccineum]